jgi:hypothetical protein
VDVGSNLCGERDGSGTRYRLDMTRNAKADNGHAVSRLADSGEETIRNLVALPLRMLAGTLAPGSDTAAGRGASPPGVPETSS